VAKDAGAAFDLFPGNPAYHLGRPVKEISIFPAAANHGLRSLRADLEGQPRYSAH